MDALQVAPQRLINLHGRVQRVAAARIPNQRDVHMGRGDDVREATINALAARQQHAKDTAELLAKAVRNLQEGEERYKQWKTEVGPITVEDFIAFGKNTVQPGYAHFRRLCIVRIWVLRVNDPLRYSSTSSMHATVLL